MDLREYLFYNRITVTDMALALGVSRTHLSLIVNSVSKPSKKLADAIEAFTHHKIKARQLRGVIERKKPVGKRRKKVG